MVYLRLGLKLNHVSKRGQSNRQDYYNLSTTKTHQKGMRIFQGNTVDNLTIWVSSGERLLIDNPDLWLNLIG